MQWVGEAEQAHWGALGRQAHFLHGSSHTRHLATVLTILGYGRMSRTFLKQGRRQSSFKIFFRVPLATEVSKERKEKG